VSGGSANTAGGEFSSVLGGQGPFNVLLDNHPLLREIERKRFAHKRAFELEGVVEQELAD
jgi:hypothetical protein